MYCSHFGLHRPPFNNTPDPTFYYSTPEHEEALATLQYATFQRKGFVLVTGEVGAGKTLIGRMFLRQVDRSATVAVITHTNLSGLQLLAAICKEFELEFSPGATNLELSELLQNYLLEEFSKDHYVVVLLDEAQNLPTESFEELRMLGNLEADDAKLLQICILGQPELRDRLQDPELKPMNQRLFRRFHLPSLTRNHMEGYIRRRLQVAGCSKDDLFTSGALDLIYVATQGTPRMVNQICDNALLTAYGEGAHQVDEFIFHLATEKELLTKSNQAPTPSATTAPTTPAITVLEGGAQACQIDEAIDKSKAAFKMAQQQASQIAQSRVEILSLTQQAAQNKSEQEAALSQMNDAVDKSKAAFSMAQQQASQIAQSRADILSLTQQTVQNKSEQEAALSQMNDAVDKSNTAFSMAQQQAGQIAQSRAEIISLTQQAIRNKSEQEAVISQVGRQYQAVQAQMESFRHELQRTLDQAVSQHQSIKRQTEELARTMVPTDALEEIRQTHLRDTSQLLEQVKKQQSDFKLLLEVADKKWNETKDQVAELANMTGQGEALTNLESEFEDKLHALVLRLDQQRKHIGDLARVFQDQCMQTRNDLQALREAQEQAGAKLSEEMSQKLAETQASFDSKISRHEEQIGSLHQYITDKLTETEQALNQLRTDSAKASDLEQVQAKQNAALSDMLQRLDEQIGQLVGFKGEIAEQTQASTQEQKTFIEEVSQRAAVQDDLLQQLRRKVLKYVNSSKKRFSELHEQFAGRAEVEELRRSQELLEKQQAMAQQLRTEQQETIAQLRLQQETQARQLLEELERQEKSLGEQLEQVSSQLKKTSEEIETLNETKAHKGQLEELRQHHARQRERMLSALSTQRRDMESLVADVSTRCEALSSQLNDLPNDIATTSQIDAIRQECSKQVQTISNELSQRKGQLEKAIADVAEHCDNTHDAVNALAKHAASAADLKKLRQQHTHKLREILERMDQQDTRHDDSVSSLGQQIEESVRRVTQLEEKTRAKPKPVCIELSPKAGSELGQIVEAAQQQQTHLTEASKQAGEIASHLHNTSSQIREALHDWVENAEEVQVQSNKLRVSGKMSSRILRAMQQCHATIDKKLNSKEWKDELARAEKLAERLEQATNRAIAVTQQLDETLSKRLEKATQKALTVTSQLDQTLTQRIELASRKTEAINSQLDQALIQRKRMLAAVAQNTAHLMEKIEAARQVDEQQRPTGQSVAKDPARRTREPLIGDERISDLEWPRFRTHSAIQAG